MFEETKEPVLENTENVEVTTEETSTEKVEKVEEPKLYTEEEFNLKLNEKIDDLLPKKLARREAKIRKEYDSKYGKLENVLKAGTGEDSIDTITEQFSEYYTNNGVEIPDLMSKYSEYDMEAGAEKEAQTIISLGFEDAKEEADRLYELGVDNMTDREKIVFKALANYIDVEETKKELATLGINEEDLKDKEYVEFKSNLNPKMSEKDKYEMYLKYKPKPKVEPMGSMTGTSNQDTSVKDYYSKEEASQFSKKDFDENPALFKAVERSMYKWK